jgi:CelD/BcsL family acetyltransferase involved in cellulose biosynthesis
MENDRNPYKNSISFQRKWSFSNYEKKSNMQNLVMTFMTMFVFMAAFSGIRQRIAEPAQSNFSDIAGAASQNLDSGTVQYVDGAVTHIARKHERDAHFREDRSNIRFTAAALRGAHKILPNNFFAAIVHCEYCKIFTMSEVAVNLVLAGR